MILPKSIPRTVAFTSDRAQDYDALPNKSHEQDSLSSSEVDLHV